MSYSTGDNITRKYQGVSLEVTEFKASNYSTEKETEAVQNVEIFITGLFFLKQEEELSQRFVKILENIGTHQKII